MIVCRYDPKAFAGLEVSEDIKNLFEYIGRYNPEQVQRRLMASLTLVKKVLKKSSVTYVSFELYN